MFREVSIALCSLLDVTVDCISFKIQLNVMIMCKCLVLYHPFNEKIGEPLWYPETDLIALHCCCLQNVVLRQLHISASSYSC